MLGNVGGNGTSIFTSSLCTVCEPQTCTFCSIISSAYINELHLILSLQLSLYLLKRIYFKDVKPRNWLDTGIFLYAIV